jgi:hypothetical protein
MVSVAALTITTYQSMSQSPPPCACYGPRRHGLSGLPKVPLAAPAQPSDCINLQVGYRVFADEVAEANRLQALHDLGVDALVVVSGCVYSGSPTAPPLFTLTVHPLPNLTHTPRASAGHIVEETRTQRLLSLTRVARGLKVTALSFSNWQLPTRADPNAYLPCFPLLAPQPSEDPSVDPLLELTFHGSPRMGRVVADVFTILGLPATDLQ